jgi:hypothetical protein
MYAIGIWLGMRKRIASQTFRWYLWIAFAAAATVNAWESCQRVLLVHFPQSNPSSLNAFPPTVQTFLSSMPLRSPVFDGTIPPWSTQLFVYLVSRNVSTSTQASEHCSGPGWVPNVPSQELVVFPYPSPTSLHNMYSYNVDVRAHSK